MSINNSQKTKRKITKRKSGFRVTRSIAIVLGAAILTGLLLSGQPVMRYLLYTLLALAGGGALVLLVRKMGRKPRHKKNSTGKKRSSSKPAVMHTSNISADRYRYSNELKDKSGKISKLNTKNYNWVAKVETNIPQQASHKVETTALKQEAVNTPVKIVTYRSVFDFISKPEKPQENTQNEVDVDLPETAAENTDTCEEEIAVTAEINEYTSQPADQDTGTGTLELHSPGEYENGFLAEYESDEVDGAFESCDIPFADERMDEYEYESSNSYDEPDECDEEDEEEELLEAPVQILDKPKKVRLVLQPRNTVEKPKLKVVAPYRNDGNNPIARPDTDASDYSPVAVSKDYLSVTIPPVELLKKNDDTSENDLTRLSHAEYNARKLVDTLASFGVGAKVVNISEGPSVTRYELQPNVGVKVSKIVNLADDIALNLAATGVRIEAPIPGKAAVGIEVPNKEVTPVLLRDVIETGEFQEHPSKLAFAVGKDIAGNTVVADIAKMPHLLIAGATGSGKSVCINTLIASILYKASPTEVKLLMVDPKVVELSIYNGIPHLLIPVVTDPKKAAGALNWAVVEMTTRYKLFADNNVRDLKGYNALLKEKGDSSLLPQIVIIIDELADLMMVAPNDVEDCICRLAQMARAAGMHLVIATQRPSVDVITGVIKANIPSRISFAVSSQIDSRTILDMSGAEKLLGRGDMLFNPIGEPKPVRVQGGFISDKEVETIVSHLKAEATVQYDEDIIKRIEKQAEPAQIDSSGDDELLPQAIELVLEMGQASTSLIQRKFKVGYSRAARIMDQMEEWGVVGQAEGSKPRQILLTMQEWRELNS